MEDSKIVDLYLARNEDAITQTANKYGFRLRRIAYGLLRNEESAEECESDTYLEAWNRIPPHEPRTYLFPFLGKIIRHKAIDRCRKKSSKKRYAHLSELTREIEHCIPSQADLEGEFEARILSQHITAFLMECSEEKRKVFVRRYWYFDRISEISTYFGYSESKVKVMLYRMREDLRLYLEKEGYWI